LEVVPRHVAAPGHRHDTGTCQTSEGMLRAVALALPEWADPALGEGLTTASSVRPVNIGRRKRYFGAACAGLKARRAIVATVDAMLSDVWS